jgi:exodeoxyribonuclease VII small subunit
MATKTNPAGDAGAANGDSSGVAATGGPAVTTVAGGPALPESYEEARDELATVVEALEAGGLTLDESLTLWERGQALAKACEKFLAGARRRVEQALAEDESLESASAE